MPYPLPAFVHNNIHVFLLKIFLQQGIRQENYNYIYRQVHLLYFPQVNFLVLDLSIKFFLMKRWAILYLIFIANISYSQVQTVNEKLARAVEQLENDAHFHHAIIGLSVYDSKADTAIYEHNQQVGLAPASTQKLFTSCAAFDLLGQHFRYK